jgi:pyruvate dehydrogenase E2 component (dihydrolipoamide acetyltransferase)
MATEFVIPNVGDNVNQVTIVSWFVKDGDEVKIDQEILEVETDKATVSIPVTATGIVHVGPYKAGDDVAVGTIVAIIGNATDTFDSYSTDDVEVPKHQVEESTSQKDVKATPVAHKMAKTLGVDLQNVTGTGISGRVTKADVLQTTDKTPQSTEAISATKSPTETPSQPVGSLISRSTLLREVDATALVDLSFQFKNGETFTPSELLVVICANALREFPSMNVRLNGKNIEPLDSINISLTGAEHSSLIEDVDRKSLQQIMIELREQAESGERGFTISDLSEFNVDTFIPAINLPELAVLGVGRIVSKPVVKDENIIIRKMWTLSLVSDNRLADGVRFLNHICELIEEPELLFLTKR